MRVVGNSAAEAPFKFQNDSNILNPLSQLNNKGLIHVDSFWGMHWAFLSLQSNVNVAHILTGLILGLHPAKERRRYKVTPSLIGWAQSKDQPYIHMHSFNGRRWNLQNTIGQQSSSDTLLGYLSRNNIFIKLATSIRNHNFITRGVVSHIKHSTTNEKRTVPHSTHLPPGQNKRPFGRRHFQSHFLEWKWLNFN